MIPLYSYENWKKKSSSFKDALQRTYPSKRDAWPILKCRRPRCFGHCRWPIKTTPWIHSPVRMDIGQLHREQRMHSIKNKKKISNGIFIFNWMDSVATRLDPSPMHLHIHSATQHTYKHRSLASLTSTYAQSSQTIMMAKNTANYDVIVWSLYNTI